MSNDDEVVRRTAAGDADRLRFHHESEVTGGSKWPNQETLHAVHPEKGRIGYLQFLRGNRVNSPILVKSLTVHPEHRRQGYGSALMDSMQQMYPKSRIDHGDRTDDGKAWWSSYGQGKSDSRGRTAAREPGSVDCWVCGGSGYHQDEGCEFCDESGYLTPGDQRRAHCPCGQKVTRVADGGDWLTHLDGSLSHDKGEGVPKAADGHYMSVSEAMRHQGARGWQRPGDQMTRMHPRELMEHIPTSYHHHPVTEQLADSMRTHGWDPERGREHVEERFGNVHEDENPVTLWHTDQGSFVEPGNHRVPAATRAGLSSIPVLVKDQRTRREASSVLPSKRLFGPTYGLDHRLFEGECLRDDVTHAVLGTLDRFWRPLYGPNWRTWARVYLAGSEASEWTSETLEGNNDFDVLVGIEYEEFRDDMEARNAGLGKLFGMMTDEQVTGALNAQFSAGLTPKTDPSMILIDGQETGPWSQTWYVNQGSWDIRKIKPYAAYDVTNHRWAVRPPRLEKWSPQDFPQGHALILECKAVEAYVRAVLKLPEPYRSQQADALWKHLHGDRSRAFGVNGEGWYDSGNVIEKWLDQKGIWEKLAQAHFDAVADPSKLLAPSNWSNDPHLMAV